MKKTIPVLLSAILLFACKTQPIMQINAWQNPNTACNVYQVTKITMGENGIYPGVSEDSISVINVTIIQKSKYWKTDGPDYCLLSIINENGDTIGKAPINGLPSLKESRTYPVFASKILNPIPDLSKMKISLPPYCDYLNKPTGTVFIDH